MRIALLTIGSQGDVRPFVALAARLQAAGHRVRLGAPRDFEALATAHGVEFRPVMERYDEFLLSARGRSMLAALSRPVFGRGSVPWPVPGTRARVLSDCARACSGAQAIICNPIASFAAAALARTGRLPVAIGYSMPALATRRFAHPFFPRWGLGAAYNRWTFARADALLGAAQAAPLMLVAVSPCVVERPEDWPAGAHLTGYWYTPGHGAAPPAELARFVAAGAPPLYIGFGSMPEEDPARLERMVLQALKQLGVRAVVLRGLSGMFRKCEGRDLIAVDSVDHDWLLPKMAAAVHHGGAGTAAACLKAGVPQVIIPYVLDQPFWGERMRRLGVASACIPRWKLSAAGLARAARAAALDPGIRHRAAALAARIRAEDGAGRAIELLEEQWRHWRHAPPRARTS